MIRYACKSCMLCNILLGSRVQRVELQLFLSGLKVAVPSLPVGLARVLQWAMTSFILDKKKVWTMR